MSEETEVVPAPAPESPPPAARVDSADGDEPRVALNRLASLLSKQRNTRFLIEYLRLRRLLRA